MGLESGRRKEIIVTALKVAKDRTKPNGRVVGIDLIPAQPPKGVSTIQGNFLSPAVQSLVKDYLVEFAGDRAPARPAAAAAAPDSAEVDSEDVASLIRDKPSYIDTERAETAWPIHYDPYEEQEGLKDEGRLVDVRENFSLFIFLCKALLACLPAKR